MNCFEFRRHFTADPRSREPDIIRHRQECAACARFAQQQEKFESRLAEALNVEVPKELRARLVLRQSLQQPRRFRTLAIAAAVLLTVALAGGWWLQSPAHSLDRIVIAHIEGERELLASRDQVPADKVAQLTRAIGMPLQGDIGTVHVAEICPIGKHHGAHLILAGEKGPVTVLLLPRETVARRKSFERGGFQGVLMPTGYGGLAVVGEPGEALDDIARRMQRALHG